MIRGFQVLLTFLIIQVFLVAGCATYYQKNIRFQEQFVKGDLEAADKMLDRNKKASKGINRLLYFLQKGMVLQLLGKYEESNAFFEQAYIFVEDHRKNYRAEMASFLSNPGIKVYEGEDHEKVLMLYFKAINYLRTGQFDGALVECRRINNSLNALNDRYERKKNRYKRDAFALNLMGIAFEASGEINDAFIAYRNSYEAYRDIYQPQFGVDIPLQLKKDLLRTAFLNGFIEELEGFERVFKMKYDRTTVQAPEVVFFWHNGLGPVKAEWSLNFFIVKGQGGAVVFVNEDLGLSIPFPVPPMGQGGNGLGDLKFVRIAFPKYLERKPYFRTAEISNGKQIYPLELAEDINEIAFKTLEDRLLREVSNSLMRLALKQAAENTMRSKNQNMGALLSVLNAVSEKADTRNWQVLPYSISYARIPLTEGNNQLKLTTVSPDRSGSQVHHFEFDAVKGQTLFHVFHSLESIPLRAY